jgi:ABC-type transporter Mla MlaB component
VPAAEEAKGDDRVEEDPVSFFVKGLELAVEIDCKNLLSLDSSAQAIVKKLFSHFKTQHQDLFITSLDDAIAILENTRTLTDNLNNRALA